MILALAAVFLLGSVFMALAWLVARRTGRSGWADAIWSLSVGVLGIAAALTPVGPADVGARQGLVATMVALWSLRLAIHIGHRTRRGGEDPRYAEMQRLWGAKAAIRLFWFLQIQAFFAALLAIAAGLAAHNPAPGVRVQDILAFLLIALAIAGENLADSQLRRFCAKAGNRQSVCEEGLWRLSRHPNYFFEWLVWTAYPLAAIDLGGGYWIGWFALAAPLLMYWLLVHVSGIPPLEAHMLRSRGQPFRDYQTRVNAFWPELSFLSTR